MIAVLDYGSGNLGSLCKALDSLGATPVVTDHPAEVKAAAAVILPGVAALVQAKSRMVAAGLDRAVLDAVAAGKPVLGVCLGLHLLVQWGEEDGGADGLGVFRGQALRFPPLGKIPHMGWNQVGSNGEVALLRGIPEGSFFYFVHSYYVKDAAPEEVAATTDYLVPFPSVLGKGRTWAVQFHPEKSGEVGLQLLRNFLEEI